MFNVLKVSRRTAVELILNGVQDTVCDSGFVMKFSRPSLPLLLLIGSYAVTMLHLEGCGSKEETQSEQSAASGPEAGPSASSNAASQSSSSSSSSRTSVRKKWSRMIPGTPGDTVQSCDASAGTYHLILKRLKRGGQNNYEVSMIGNKCGTETVPETPLNGENTAKLQEDGISCAEVWEALAITTASSNEATLSAMCIKLKEGQL